MQKPLKLKWNRVTEKKQRSEPNHEKNPFIQQFKGPNFTLKGPRFPQIWKIQRNPHYENYHSKVKFESRPDNTEKSVIMHDKRYFCRNG